MTKGSSGSPLKKVHSVIVLGKKTEGTHMAALEVSPLSGQNYGLTFEGKFMLPELKNRFNVEKILEEPLRGTVEAKLSFGQSTNMKHVKVHAEFEKTEELKREIRESPEFKKCMVEQQHQQLLAPICSIVRRQAASMDKTRITIDTPKSWARSSFMTLLDGVSKALLLGNIESEEISTGVEGRVFVEARAERTSNLVTAKVQTPSRKVLLRNLRLMGYTESIFPATRLFSPMEVAALKMTTKHIPATCRVEPTLVRTFDNKTVEYKINDCEHVLLMDGSKHIPMAVTTRTLGSEKVVKILSGITEAQIIPTSSGSLKVLINKEEVHPIVGQKLIKKNTEGKTIAIVQLFQDNVVSVHVPEQGLKVLSDGSRIEVVAPMLLKSRSVGLCGDMNGERSADLKTPGMCVMRPHLAAITYMLNKSGSASGFERCSGLPTAIREEFEHET